MRKYVIAFSKKDQGFVRYIVRVEESKVPGFEHFIESKLGPYKTKWNQWQKWFDKTLMSIEVYPKLITPTDYSYGPGTWLWLWNEEPEPVSGDVYHPFKGILFE